MHKASYDLFNTKLQTCLDTGIHSKSDSKEVYDVYISVQANHGGDEQE